MPESKKPFSYEPSVSQIESLNILAELNKAEILEIPGDKRKYLTYGNLLQVGKLPSASGKLKRISSPDIKYLPIPKDRWSQTQGSPCEIRILPGDTYSQVLKEFCDGELQLKYVTPSSQIPEVKLKTLHHEIPSKTEAFLNLLIISFSTPKKAKKANICISIKNTGDQPLVFLGVNQELKIRFVAPTEMINRSISRKLKRGVTLIRNGEFKALLNAIYYTGIGKLNSIKRKMALFLALALLNSCVLPPDSSGPRVYSKEEIDFITDSQKGISYSQSGRFDLAELNLRLALESSKTPPTLLLSNLGFVLRAQGKYQDALVYLKRALKQDPHFLHARVTLGRTYFELGELDESIKEYLKAEADYYGYWKGAPDKRLSNDFTNSDLLSVFTNLAIMYAQNGLIAESICYSQKGLDLRDKNYKPQAHARFLISLEQFFLAGEVLRQIIFTGSQITAPLPASLASTTTSGTVPVAPTIVDEDPSSIQDIGVVRLLENNLPLAAEAFDRVLTLTIVPENDRLLTKLLRYEVATAQNDSETIELLNQSFLEITAGLCESDSYVTPPYWPIRLRDRILERRNLICRTYG